MTRTNSLPNVFTKLQNRPASSPSAPSSPISQSKSWPTESTESNGTQDLVALPAKEKNEINPPVQEAAARAPPKLQLIAKQDHRTFSSAPRTPSPLKEEQKISLKLELSSETVPSSDEITNFVIPVDSPRAFMDASNPSSPDSSSPPQQQKSPEISPVRDTSTSSSVSPQHTSSNNLTQIRTTARFRSSSVPPRVEIQSMTKDLSSWEHETSSASDATATTSLSHLRKILTDSKTQSTSAPPSPRHSTSTPSVPLDESVSNLRSSKSIDSSLPGPETDSSPFLVTTSTLPPPPVTLPAHSPRSGGPLVASPRSQLVSVPSPRSFVPKVSSPLSLSSFSSSSLESTSQTSTQEPPPLPPLPTLESLPLPLSQLPLPKSPEPKNHKEPVRLTVTVPSNSLETSPIVPLASVLPQEMLQKLKTEIVSETLKEVGKTLKEGMQEAMQVQLETMKAFQQQQLQQLAAALVKEQAVNPPPKQDIHEMKLEPQKQEQPGSPAQTHVPAINEKTPDKLQVEQKKVVGNGTVGYADQAVQEIKREIEQMQLEEKQSGRQTSRNFYYSPGSVDNHKLSTSPLGTDTFSRFGMEPSQPYTTESNFSASSLPNRLSNSANQRETLLLAGGTLTDHGRDQEWSASATPFSFKIANLVDDFETTVKIIDGIFEIMDSMEELQESVDLVHEQLSGRQSEQFSPVSSAQQQTRVVTSLDRILKSFK